MSENAEFISAKELAKRIGCGESTVWAWVKEARLPDPLRMGKRFTRWNWQEVREFLKTRKGGCNA